MKLELKELQRQVGYWSKKNFPNGKKYQPLLGAVEELGELCHAHLKEEQKIRGYDDRAKAINAKMDAIGDTIIYLADYCQRNGLSLETCVKNTWLTVQARNWLQDKQKGGEETDG